MHNFFALILYRTFKVQSAAVGLKLAQGCHVGPRQQQQFILKDDLNCQELRKQSNCNVA